MARSKHDPSSTIAIIFGASSFPNYPTLDSSEAFLTSAQKFEAYLTSRSGLRLPVANVKFLFDEDLQPGELVDGIRAFIDQKRQEIPALTDVIFYYCGHGAYLKEKEYFLALKCTSRTSKEPTVFKVSYLVDIIADLTREQRNLVVLDACYSGAAMTEFAHMSDEDAAEVVTQQLFEYLPSGESAAEDDREDERGGAILFCAAGPKKWAKTPLEAQLTMFSGALINALDTGDRKAGPYLTLKRLAQLVDGEIHRVFGAQGVRPQIHVPVQGKHDLLDSPYFPNPAYDASVVEDRLDRLEDTLSEIKRSLGKQERIYRELPSGSPDAPPARGKSDDATNGSKHGWQQGIMSFLIDIKTVTLAGCALLDMATYIGLDAVLGASKTTDFFFSFWMTAFALHAIVASIATLLVVAQRRGSTSVFLELFPHNLSYMTIAWNSILMGLAVALSFFFIMHKISSSTVSDTDIAGTAISSSTIRNIQTALCLPVDGQYRPTTQSAVRDYMVARGQIAALRSPGQITPRIRELLDEAVEQVGDCRLQGFANAFEVGALGFPPQQKEEKIKELQRKLHSHTGVGSPVRDTGVIDGQTRRGISELRTSLGLPPGEQIDQELWQRL